MRGLIGRRFGGTGGVPFFGTRLVQPGALAGGGITTFSRAQVGMTSTAISSNGGGNWWTEYAADVPRYAGTANRLMLGGQRTTVNTRQRLIGGAGWALNNVTAATTTGPDGGGATANRLDEGSTASTHNATHGSVSFTSGITYSMSAIVKAETCSSCQLIFSTAAFGATAWQNFDLNSGTLGTGGAGALNPRIVSLGAGWFWISMTCVATITASTNPVTLCMTTSASAARNESYTGTNRTMLTFWGWTEESDFPSSAMLATTEPNAATRGQDSLTSSFSTLFPAGVGTTLGSFLLPFNAVGADQAIFDINNGTLNNRIRLRNVAGGNTIVMGRTIGGVNIDAASLGSMTPGTLFRVGITFDGTNIVANLNGGTNQTVAGYPTGLTTLRIGNNSAGTAPMFGEVGYSDALPYVIPAANLPAAVTAIP
jgi:hypothetical protein